MNFKQTLKRTIKRNINPELVHVKGYATRMKLLTFCAVNRSRPLNYHWRTHLYLYQLFARELLFQTIVTTKTTV